MIIILLIVSWFTSHGSVYVKVLSEPMNFMLSVSPSKGNGRSD